MALAGLRRHVGQFLSTSNELMATSLSTASCAEEMQKAEGVGCRDDEAALRLKEVAMAAILVTGVLGVGLPLAGRKRRALRSWPRGSSTCCTTPSTRSPAPASPPRRGDSSPSLGSSPCSPRSPRWCSTSWPPGSTRPSTATRLRASRQPQPQPPRSLRPPPRATRTSPWSPSRRTRARPRSCKRTATGTRTDTDTDTATATAMDMSWCKQRAARGRCRRMSDTGDGDSVSLCDHRVVTGSVAEPLHNQATCCSTFIPPVLRGVCIRQVHCSGTIQEHLGRFNGILLCHYNTGRDSCWGAWPHFTIQIAQGLS